MTTSPTTFTTPLPRVASPGASETDPLHTKLRQAADALDGMFLRQLFSAMRDTVPSDDGMGSAGGSLFTQMLDDTMADHAASQVRGGLGDALYRQLCARLTPARGSNQ
jgi:Rod binding domain-containing protein